MTRNSRKTLITPAKLIIAVGLSLIIYRYYGLHYRRSTAAITVISVSQGDSNVPIAGVNGDLELWDTKLDIRFSEGLSLFNGKWFLYYGCADTFVGVTMCDSRIAAVNK
jgi:hypothetical protein